MNNKRFGSGINKLFLIAGKHGLQISVVSFWFCTTDEARFLWFSGRGDADALNSLRRFLFAVVIISDLVFVAINIEADLRQINLRAKVMGVLKLCLSAGSLLRVLKLNLSRQAKTILQITSVAGEIFSGAYGNDLRRAFEGTTEDDALIPVA